MTHSRTALAFVSLLLERPRRITALMLHWNARQPCKGASLRSVWRIFVHTLLYAPLNVCVDSTGVYPFGVEKSGTRAFFISFSWMDPDERRALWSMIQDADNYFTNREKVYTGGHCLYSGFIGNTNKRALPLVSRKKLLRSFTALVYQVTPQHRLTLAVMLQDLGIDKADPFYVLMSKSLLGYTPDGPSLTPIS